MSHLEGAKAGGLAEEEEEGQKEASQTGVWSQGLEEQRSEEKAQDSGEPTRAKYTVEHMDVLL